MKITYDASVDAIYITLSGTKIADTREEEGGLIVDYDEDGGVSGIEILDASRLVDHPESITYSIIGWPDTPNKA